VTASRSRRARWIGGTEQLASRRARSSSVAEKVPTSGDDTDSTPMVAPSETSGSTTIDPMANPCPTATRKRSSLLTSTMRAGRPCFSTHPEMPSPARSCSDGVWMPMPDRAPASRFVREASSRRIEAWSPGSTASAASVTRCSASSRGRPSVSCSVS